MNTITQVAYALIKDWEEYAQRYSVDISRKDLTQILKGKETCFTGGIHLDENVAPWIVGTAVDYLSRMVLTGNKAEAFYISLMFKKNIQLQRCAEGHEQACRYADNLLEGITGLDDKSIENACRLVCFDQLYRADGAAFVNCVKELYECPPDGITLNHIRTMVGRCIGFFVNQTVTETGFEVKNERIHGDGDILTKTGLWDIKTSKRKSLTLNDKLQVLLYWSVGLQTNETKFSEIKTLGIYNPRHNFSWELDVSQLPEDIVEHLKAVCEFDYF